MNGQLFQSYCRQYGDEIDLCNARNKSRTCVNCPYNSWVIRTASVKQEQSNNDSDS